MTATDKKNMRGKHILLVDDDYEFRVTLKEALQAAGFVVTDVADATTARKLLWKSKYSAVVSDIRMPKVNGIEFLHQVRKFNSVPFILMSGFSEIMADSEALEIGANGFVAKPFRAEELFNVLKNCI
ncbi:MAG: response regulator [Oligoflexia bacterium]|nr:response regulator [Oligoflexia bacterium]